MSTASKANAHRAPPDDAVNDQPSQGGGKLETPLSQIKRERDTAIERAKEFEQQLKAMKQELEKLKHDASLKAQLSGAKAFAAENAKLQTRLKEAIARANDAEKRAVILEKEKESAQDTVETMIDEHGALVEEREQLGKENGELKAWISGLLVKKSSQLLSVPDSDVGEDEVDGREGAVLSSHMDAKKRRSEATTARGAERPSHTAQTPASTHRRRRRSSPIPPPPESESDLDFGEVETTEVAARSDRERTKRRRLDLTRTVRSDGSGNMGIAKPASRRRGGPSVTPPPQGDLSDFDFDLPTDADENPRPNFRAQPVPRSAWRSVREETEDNENGIEIAVSSSRKTSKRRRFAATERGRNDHSRNTIAMASAPRRRRRLSPTPESLSDSESELPFNIDEVRRPGFTAQPIPRSIWKAVRKQMAVWDERRPEWRTRTQEEKLVCASSYTRKKSSEFPDGQENACSHCKKQGNICVVVCGGRKRLLPVKGAEAMGEESEEYWRTAVPEKKM